MYEIIKNKPVAKFFYKGTHSHPVKRTVLITENDKEVFKGYELREGSTVREVENAPIKSFRKDKIATTSQLRKNSAGYNESDNSTLERMSMTKLQDVGI